MLQWRVNRLGTLDAALADVPGEMQGRVREEARVVEEEKDALRDKMWLTFE